MAKQKLSIEMLKLALDMVFLRYKQSLADPGLAIGMIASLSLHEMYTQFMLDSKHRAGTQVTDKLRGIEIIVAAKTEAMKNPQMLLHVKPEFERDREKVVEIANKLEIVHFSQFILNEPYVFGGEQFGAPKHHLLANQTKYIEEMKRYQGIQVPSDLTSHIILFRLDVEQMIQRYLGLDIIIHALRAFDSQIFIVHSTDSTPVPEIACYVRAPVLTKGTHKSAIDNLLWSLQNTVLRGIDRIISTEVVDFQVTRQQSDGSLKQESIYAIRTRGTNMREMLTIDELDVDRCQSNSIHEMADVLGIVAGYRKIITEMRVSFNGPAFAHFTVYASEMTHTGRVTGITKSGANLRDNDVLPRASYVSPIPTIVEAAINGVTNKIRGASAALMLGAEIRDIGTSASKIIIDEDAVERTQKSVEDLL
jgi:DNA-directed RNA polymerase beta' subunit